MYIVKANQEPVDFQIDFQVTDSEGNPASKESLVVAVESDNTDAVSVARSGQNARSGQLSFGRINADGSPAFANVNVKVANQDGRLLGSFGAQFTIVAGDPDRVSGGSLTIDGLSESSGN